VSKRVGRRTILTSAMAWLAAPAVMRLARADAPPITLKLHHFFSSVSSGHDKFLAPWARQVETDSGGRLRIDIFPSMQLGGTPAALFDQVKNGDADIVWAAPNLTPGRFPKIETFELPFLPSRRALVSSKALQDFAALYLKDEFKEVHPIAFSCSDRGVIHANAAIRTVEDIKDLKLHVQTRLAGEAMRVLGAEPVPMPYGQLPMAITEHVVDGCVDPWHMVPPLRLNDLLKCHTEFSDLSVSSTTFVLVMNQDVYDRLSRDLKAVIDRNSGQFAAGMAGAMWDVQAGMVASDIGERGDVIVTLLPEAVAHWRQATEPVVTAWLKGMKEQKVDGGKMLASAHALLEKYANEPEPQPAPSPSVAEQNVTTEPQTRPQGSVEMTAAPKVDSAAMQSPAPVGKPAPPPGPATPASPAPHVATQTPTLAPTPSVMPPAPPVPQAAAPAAAPAPVPPPSVTPPAPATASAVPVVKPVPLPPHPVTATPPAPVVVAPVAPAPPVPTLAPVAPPKPLNIPL
jgi:TRAP-type C4-dicarboxylate transport system substrate-binding protein